MGEDGFVEFGRFWARREAELGPESYDLEEVLMKDLGTVDLEPGPRQSQLCPIRAYPSAFTRSQKLTFSRSHLAISPSSAATKLRLTSSSC